MKDYEVQCLKMPLKMVPLCYVIGEVRFGLLFDELGCQLGFTAR